MEKKKSQMLFNSALSNMISGLCEDWKPKAALKISREEPEDYMAFLMEFFPPPPPVPLSHQNCEIHAPKTPARVAYEEAKERLDEAELLQRTAESDIDDLINVRRSLEASLAEREASCAERLTETRELLNKCEKEVADAYDIVRAEEDKAMAEYEAMLARWRAAKRLRDELDAETKWMKEHPEEAKELAARAAVMN